MKAITDFLDEDDPRVIELYKQVLKIDAIYNNNKEAEKELNRINGNNMNISNLSSSNSPFLRHRGMIVSDEPETETSYTEEDIASTMAYNGEQKTDSHQRKMYDILGFRMTLFEIIFIALILLRILKKH
jgi:hypothetical protein